MNYCLFKSVLTDRIFELHKSPAESCRLSKIATESHRVLMCATGSRILSDVAIESRRILLSVAESRRMSQNAADF